jgi:hypothetical protein
MTLIKTAQAAEQERSDIAAKRRAWFNAQPDLNSERLGFINETGASTKRGRLRGRIKHGQRCRATVPHGHSKTTVFIRALRLSGMTAPMVLNGPMNRTALATCIEQMLVPTLRPGDIVIVDKSNSICAMTA